MSAAKYSAEEFREAVEEGERVSKRCGWLNPHAERQRPHP